MGYATNIYTNKDWVDFAEKVKRRDGYKCLHCGRASADVTLQVHHDIYVAGKAPWEYALSACRTLCKGCHAREHGLIEPDRGWILLSIDDLGGQDGTCERNGCGAEIRYEHLTYHPKWGYMVVGSTCIEHLTQEDRQLSSSIVHLYKNVAGFVHKSHWDEGVSQRRRFIYSTYKHHQLRIYGEEPRHSFQLLLKKKGVWVFDYTNEVETPGKSTLTVKELAYTTMRGRLSDSEEEKGALRNLYRALMYDTMQTPHQCGSEEP